MGGGAGTDSGRAAGAAYPNEKGQDDQRHTRGIAYRCYLPVLTGFTSSGCAGPGPLHVRPMSNGGDDRIRTDDPLVANEVLSQLSYIPTKSRAWPWRFTS